MAKKHSSLQTSRLGPIDSRQPFDQTAVSWWIEILLLFVLVGVGVGIVDFIREVTTPSAVLNSPGVTIDLSLRSLPGYAFLSLMRSFAAYGLSLSFALIYGGIAAHNKRAERIMIPILDILQGIPVLGFLPGLVLGMVALFPNSRLGLELSCIIMIFTAQVWNMVFSFYGSLRAIPTELKEVARLSHLGWWKTFRVLEVPFSMISLIWNSMMSMAGGWFFLTVNEAFRLGDRDFRLPGIGSYMSEAIDKNNSQAMLFAIVTMAIMIVATDQFLWRPIAAWAHRFKVEEIGGSERPSSWVLDLLRHSRVVRQINHVTLKLSRYLQLTLFAPRIQNMANPLLNDSANDTKDIRRMVFLLAMGATVLAIALLVFYGVTKICLLIFQVKFSQWIEIVFSLLLTFLRTSSALLLSCVWTIPIGIIIGRSSRLSRLFQPVVQLAASFPAPMLYPIVTTFLLFIGIPFSYGCVALMLLGCQWYILFNVIAGAQGIPSDLIEVGQVYGVKGFRNWRNLLLPSVFPSLITGLITAAGGAWNASIVSEAIHFKGQNLFAPGLGSLITRVTASGDFGMLAASIMVMSLTLVVINRLVWKPLYALSDRHFALNR